MRFDDIEYVNRFKAKGEYPAIHADIYEIAKGLPVDKVIDLGCCTGLLARHLSEHYKLVVGIEPSKRYLDNAIQAPNIEYVRLAVTADSLVQIKHIIKDKGIKAVIARRVIPEIYETGGFSLCDNFISLLHDSGIEYIAIEGRKSNSNAKNPLHSIAEESRIFRGKYVEIASNKNCKLLRRMQ